MRQTLLRWMYRILAPRHPRGWLEVEAVGEDESGGTVWVHCHGMERWELPNVEIVGVPADLRGYAHGILFDVTGHMKSSRGIRPDEGFGGLLVSRRQRGRHEGTLRPVERPDDPAHSGALRIVDFGQPADSGFPRRLFAVHLVSLADLARGPATREKLFRRAVAIWPGDPTTATTEGPFEPGSNENNFLAWEGLGDALCDRGRFDDGILHLEEAVARCPRWAREFAEHIRSQYGPRASESADPRFTFWSQLDVEEVRRRVLERRARPRPSSAGNRDDGPDPPRKPR